MKTLLKNATVISFENNKAKITNNCNIGINDNYISYVGKSLPQEKYDVVKDMTNKLLFPGFYNCHTHTSMVLLRGLGSDLPLDKWLFDTIFPVEDKLIPEDIATGSELAVMEMLSCGTVSFSDMYFFPEKTIEVVEKTGIKANISRPVQCFNPDENPKDNVRIKESLELFNNYHKAFNGRVLVDFCIHAEYTCDEKTTAYYSEKCNEHKGNMHIHLSETQKEHLACLEKYKKTPAKWFADLGAFDSNAFAAHCVTLSEEDMELLKSKNVSIVHNPTSNLKLASGIAPINKYLSKGINITLGTDGAASNNNLDLIEEMHLASIIHKGALNDPTVINCEDVLKMATLNGALLQGRKQCGNIEVGFKADIVGLSLDAPNMIPCLDPLSMLVYSSGQHNVCLTMVDGKILYENGEFLTIDKEKVFFETKKSIERLYS